MAEPKDPKSIINDMHRLLKKNIDSFARMSGTTEGVEQLFVQLKDKLEDELIARSDAMDNLRNQRIANSRLREKLGQYSGTLGGVISSSLGKIKEADAQVELAKSMQALTAKSITELQNEIEGKEEGTDEYKELTTQLQRLQKRYKDEADIIETKVANAYNKKLEAMTNVSKALNKLIAPIRKLQQEFGISAGAAANLRFDALAQSILSYSAILGRAPVSFEEIEKAASDLRAEFGGIVSGKEATELAITAKEMGVTTQQLAAARRVFMTQTMGDLSGAQRQQERFIRVFTQQGMTSRDAMEFIGKNSELLARSGIRFQQSMAKAAGEAKKIGVDLSKVNQVGDNIIGNFEGFLESMAELGAMGFGFDATRLAEVAERGDTGALFDELRSQLRMTGRDLTDLTRSQQLALSNAFGMNIEDFQRMAGVTPDVGEAETQNKFLKRVVDTAERIAGILTGLSTILGSIHTTQFGTMIGLLKIMAGVGPGLIGKIKEKIFGPRTGAVPRGPGGTPIPPASASPAPGAPAGGAPAGGTAPQGGLLERFFGNVKPSQLLAAGAAMIMVSGAMFIMAKAFQEFSKGVTVGGVGAATTAMASLAAIAFGLSKIDKDIIRAAFSLGIISAAVFVAGKAFQEFSGIDWKGVYAGVLALSAFGALAAAAGTLFMPLLIGAGVIATLATAMWIFAKAMDAVAIAVATGASAISSVGTGIDYLISRAGGIFKLSLAFTALAGSLLLLGKFGSVAIPILLALAATAGAVGFAAGMIGSMNKNKANEGDNSLSRPGYGEKTLVTPGATIALHNDDNVVAYAGDLISTNAGTELLSKGAIAESAQGTPSDVNVKVDLQALEKKLDQVISAMASMQVVMDGNKVGRVMSNNEQQASTMGVFQTQRL